MRHNEDEAESAETAEGMRFQMLAGLNRLMVASGVLVLIFGSLVAIGVISNIDFRTFVAEKNAIQNLFQAMILILITGVTLVLSINQIVLSQELVAASNQRERLEEALDFRADVANVIEPEVSPARPSQFFGTVLRAMRDHLQALQNTASEVGSTECQSAVDQFVDDLVDEIDAVIDPLEGARFGSFGVIGTALQFDNSNALFDARQLQEQFGDEFTEEMTEPHDCVLQTLEAFALAREYFKSLFIQRELIKLSERMIYTSIPALITSLAFVMFVDETALSGQTFGVDHLLLAVAAATTLAVTPFVLLIVYVLRVGLITRLTLAIGPFEVE